MAIQRCGTENDPDQDRWHYCAKCGVDLRGAAPPPGGGGPPADGPSSRRVFTGAGFEANAFLVIGCGAFLFAAWLVFQALTARPSPVSIVPYLWLGAAATVGAGIFLVVQFFKRGALSVEVSYDMIVVRDGNGVTETVPIADIVNFFALAARDMLNRPSITRPRSHVLLVRSHQVVLLIGIADEAEMCQHIANLLCARHLARLRAAVGQGSHPVADGVILTPAGVRDAKNPEDGLAWDELAFDTGGDPNDDEQLRLWKRGARFMSWRVIPAREITLFPVVVALMDELCRQHQETKNA